MNKASCWKHIIKRWNWNSPKGQHSQELSELFMLAHPEQLLNSFKYAGFTFHLFTLPKVPGLRTCFNLRQDVWTIVKSKMKDISPNNTEDQESAIRAPRASRTPQQSRRPKALLQSCITAVNHAKGTPSKRWERSDFILLGGPTFLRLWSFFFVSVIV